jgi:ribosomal-protein-alanine N-acetyltransferase
MRIRPGTLEDHPFLEKMLFEAIFWNPDTARPDMTDFFNETKLNRFLADWGRRGDKSLIAEERCVPIGAAWYRRFKAKESSYGFVDENTPEIGMAVVKNYRSQGMGRKLLRALVLEAQREGFEALSLSVDPANFALSLYESEGFTKVGESGTSWTLRRKLEKLPIR